MFDKDQLLRFSEKMGGATPKPSNIFGRILETISGGGAETYIKNILYR